MSFLRKLIFLHLRQAQLFYSQGVKPNAMDKRYSKRTIIIDKIFETCITKYSQTFTKPNLSEKELEDMRNSLLSIGKLKPSIIDSVVLDICIAKKYINTGKSYYKYIEACDSEPSIVTTVKYLKLFEDSQNMVSEADREHILMLYKYIKEHFQSFNHITANACVASLCAIGEWKESMEIIKNFEAYDSTFLCTGYSALINYFYAHGQAKLGYKYLETSCKEGCGPMDYVYNTYLEYCLKERETFDKNIEKLFNLWKKYDIKPSSETVQKYIDACNKFGWSATLAHVTLLKCNICGLELSEQTLSDQEFKVLSQTVMRKLFLQGSYMISSPKESTNFIKFIKKTAPYDIIIDGLNILMNVKTKNYHRLDKLITYFNMKKKKLLVIGRQHLARLPPIRHLQSKAAFYFVDNSSQDDAFILYAAMASGNNCKIVTQDFLRKQKFCLDDHEMRVLFKRWQLSHQCMQIDDLMKPMHMNLVHSVNYAVQKQDKYWHIPYHSLNCTQRMQYTEPDQWACLKMCT